MKIYLIILGAIFFSFDGLCGNIRSIRANQSTMEPLRLSLGQSTVLRFQDKPKKVIVGNQNYFNIEFLGNDLAIQPLSKVETNLFVYCDYGRVYGFLLKIGHPKNYDDIVNIKWRVKKKIQLNKKVTHSKGKKGLKRSLSIAKKLRINVDSISKNKELNLYFIDMKANNLTNAPLSLENLTLSATRSNIPLDYQKVIIKDEKLKKKESTEIRMVLKLKKRRGFSLNFKYLKKNRKIIIHRRFL